MQISINEPHSDMNGWVPLGDVELKGIMQTYQKKRGDLVLKRLIGLYQTLRNEKNERHAGLTRAGMLINSLMLNTNHLSLQDQVIVMCQNIKDLRKDIEEYKIEREAIYKERDHMQRQRDDANHSATASNAQNVGLFLICCILSILMVMGLGH